MDRASFRKEEEHKDLLVFLDAYERATGERLDLLESREDPDFVCVRPDESEIGIELTQIRRSPDDAFWEEILDQRDEMDPDAAADELWRLAEKKARRRGQYRTAVTILVLLSCEADFRLLLSRASKIPIEDFSELGFHEIWLADFSGFRSGAHREAPIFGLYPDDRRVLTNRSDFDSKPFG
jgi:hypothetical protein